MALTKKRPETIPFTLTIKGQGETIELKLTYYNRTKKEVDAVLMEHGLEAAILFVVKEWDSEYSLDTAGVEEAEQDRPGLIIAVSQGFHVARMVHAEKN